ncbi:hypothetical protein B0H14DRAFT_1128235 [Mycena olivaceomarginata]|nr:hypothetical protein B0H14DRAFT_1128235 [Mycena olivaceomarginata]
MSNNPPLSLGPRLSRPAKKRRTASNNNSLAATPYPPPRYMHAFGVPLPPILRKSTPEDFHIPDFLLTGMPTFIRTRANSTEEESKHFDDDSPSPVYLRDVAISPAVSPDVARRNGHLRMANRTRTYPYPLPFSVIRRCAPRHAVREPRGGLCTAPRLPSWGAHSGNTGRAHGGSTGRASTTPGSRSSKPNGTVDLHRSLEAVSSSVSGESLSPRPDAATSRRPDGAVCTCTGATRDLRSNCLGPIQ